MGVSSQEKEELAAYQLKYVAQVLHEQWKDERPIREFGLRGGIQNVFP